MRKQRIRVAAGAEIRHLDLRFWNAGFHKNLVIGFPEIQLVFTVWFPLKQTTVDLFGKSLCELLGHIFADFVAVLADRGSDCRQQL